MALWSDFGARCLLQLRGVIFPCSVGLIRVHVKVGILSPESTVRSAGSTYAYFFSVPQDVNWHFQTFAVVSDRKPRRASGCVRESCSLCRAPCRRLCSRRAGCVLAPMLGLPLRAPQTPGRGFRGQRGCSGWSLAPAPLLTSGRPLPNQASSSVWYSVSGLPPYT